jgi:hypothetical protein
MTTLHTERQTRSRLGAGQPPPAGRRGPIAAPRRVVPVVGAGVISGFTGTFTAVLIFSILLAVLCLFSISRFARVASIRGAR